jgi:hypothetical protein
LVQDTLIRTWTWTSRSGRHTAAHTHSIHIYLPMAPLFQMEALLPGSKISSILQSHVYPRVGRVFRALARFKSLLLDALGKSKHRGIPWSSTYHYHARKTTTKIVSHMTNKPHSSSWTGGGSSARWNDVMVPAPAGVDDCAGEYCGYLRWLEDDAPDEVLVLEEEEEEEDDDVDGAGGGNTGFNEIDSLAEKFIARCHAKFLLEKQESYRRYQEMMARSV